MRLSQRKPRSTVQVVDHAPAAHLPPQHDRVTRQMDNKYKTERQPAFQRSTSLTRDIEHSPVTQATNLRRSHSLRPQQQIATLPSRYELSRGVVNSGTLRNEKYVTAAVPFQRNRYQPIRAKTSRVPKHADVPELNNNDVYAHERFQMLNEIQRKFPPAEYDVTRVSSRVFPSQSASFDATNSLQRRSSEPQRKSLLRKPDEQIIDVVDEFGSSDFESSTLSRETAPKILHTKSGEKHLELTVDVGGFNPHDIQIVTQGKLLQVVAKGTVLKQSGHSNGATRVYRELKRQFALPEVASAEHLHGVLNANGILAICGPIGIKDTNRKRKSKKVKFAFD